MKLSPIIAALRKHKAGVFLIGLQIALTLAIVCNVIYIVALRVQRIDRPTGLQEKDLFLIAQSYVNPPTGTGTVALEKLDSMQLTDLAALRSAPDIQDATPVNSLPALRGGSTVNVSLKPAQLHGLTQASVFNGDAQMLPTLGLKLVAGRDFTRADVQRRAPGSNTGGPIVIVTRALADKLYPRGDAVGKPLYINENTAPSTIVGVVARMLGYYPDAPNAFVWNGVLIPARTDGASTMYAVRAKPGRMREAIREARDALFRVDPMRIIPAGSRYDMDGVHTFAQIRAWGFALDIFMVKVLTVICVILLLITGVGMAGLTSFWVTQRYKQIGIRRALGATRANILHYFQIENLFIAGMGCTAGIVLAIGINLALMSVFAMHRMPVGYVLIGIVVILLLGQLAVFAPARRASNVPPVVATRSV
ncbi:MAG: ABC transporter permease [Rhodanobacteraceae bacterium]